MRVKYISLFHIVNKSSKFNIGQSEFVITCIIINNKNEPKISICLKWRENPKTFYLFVTRVCLIQSVN